MNYLMRYLNKSQATRLSKQIRVSAHHVCRDTATDLSDIAGQIEGREGYVSNLIQYNNFRYCDSAISILNNCLKDL